MFSVPTFALDRVSSLRRLPRFVNRLVREIRTPAATDTDIDAASASDTETTTDSGLLTRLGDLRRQFLEENPREADRLQAFAQDLWSLCAEEGMAHLQLPPLYPSEQVLSLLVMAMRLCVKAPTSGPSGNTILWGVRGVGKSTLLLFTALAAAVFTNALVIVDDLCVDDVTPDRHIGKAILSVAEDLGVVGAAAAAGTDHTVPNEVADAVFDSKKVDSVVVLLDELNGLYTTVGTDTHEFSTLQKAIVEYGRTDRFSILTSGSSNDLNNMAFKQHTWKGSIYVNMNDTVFKLRLLSPIRDVTQLTQYCQKRYGAVPPGIDVVELFKVTGGVGRLIHEIMKAAAPAEALGEARLDLKGRFDAYLSSKGFLHLLAILMHRIDSVSTSEVKDPSATLSDIKSGVRDDDLVAMVNDSWVLHLVVPTQGTGRYSFLYPVVFDFASKWLSDDMDARSLHDFRLCLQGKGDGRPAEFSIVRRHYENLGLVTQPDEPCVLSKTGGTWMVKGPGPLTRVELSSVDPEYLVDKYLVVGADSGCDVFTISLADDDDDDEEEEEEEEDGGGDDMDGAGDEKTLFQVTVGQVKVGQHYQTGTDKRTRFGPGSATDAREILQKNAVAKTKAKAARATARAKAKTKGQAKPKSTGKAPLYKLSESVGSAVAKGERAFGDLLAILNESFGESSAFEPFKFVLLTSKVVNQVGQVKLKNPFLWEGEEFPCEIIADDQFWGKFTEEERLTLQPPPPSPHLATTLAAVPHAGAGRE